MFYTSNATPTQTAIYFPRLQINWNTVYKFST